MTNRHMKRCSTFFVIREFQSKRQTKYYYTHTMLLKLKTLTGLNADKDMEQHDFSFIAGSNTKWHSHLGRKLVVLGELNILP